MLANIIFSINCVLPFFLLIALGGALAGFKLVSRGFFKLANTFVFRVSLPVQLFLTVAETASTDGATGFLLYTLAITAGSFGAIWLITELCWKEKALIGTLVQGAFRGNFVLLGIPLARAVLGESAERVAAFATIGVVIGYNALSVFVLLARGNSGKRQSAWYILGNAAKNPLIVGAVLGLPLMLMNIQIPYMLSETLHYVAQIATPLGLLSIGGTLNLADATARLKPALYSSAIKVVLLPLAAVSMSVLLGYRGPELLVLLVLTASPAAVSSYAMAVEMDGDGPTASNILIITTFTSAFMLALGIYLLKTFSLI
jgi:predicted permease